MSEESSRRNTDRQNAIHQKRTELDQIPQPPEDSGHRFLRVNLVVRPIFDFIPLGNFDRFH
jgi:hypothetical protein